MNWDLAYAIGWFAVMIGLFIVTPVAAVRYRGGHRRASGRPR